jgi:hypothetical protein
MCISLLPVYTEVKKKTFFDEKEYHPIWVLSKKAILRIFVATDANIVGQY